MALTIPAQRIIRADKGVRKCNATKLVLCFAEKSYDRTAEPENHLVQPLMIGTGDPRILSLKTYLTQNACNIRLLRAGYPSSGWVHSLKDEAAAGPGQTVQREDIPMLLKEPPHFGLFPAPATPQRFQCQNGAA